MFGQELFDHPAYGKVFSLPLAFVIHIIFIKQKVFYLWLVQYLVESKLSMRS